MRNARDVPYILGIDGTPLRPLLMDVEVEHVLDQYSILTITSPAGERPPVRIDNQIIYRGHRYLMNSMKTSAIGNSIVITADIAYLKLSKDFTAIDMEDVPLGSIAYHILEGTNWAIEYSERLDAIHTLIADDEDKLSMLRMLARMSGLVLVFDTINYRVSFVDPDDYYTLYLAQEGVNIGNLEQTVEDIQATVLYPIGVDDVVIGSVNGGVDYVENYDYYLSQGFSIEEARKRFRRVEYRKYDNIRTPHKLLDAAVKDLATMAVPRVTYSADLDVLPHDVKAGDYFAVPDSLSDGDKKARVQVVRFVEYSDTSQNVVELNHMVPLIGTDNSFASDNGTGTGGDGMGSGYGEKYVPKAHHNYYYFAGGNYALTQSTDYTNLMTNGSKTSFNITPKYEGLCHTNLSGSLVLLDDFSPNDMQGDDIVVDLIIKSQGNVVASETVVLASKKLGTITNTPQSINLDAVTKITPSTSYSFTFWARVRPTASMTTAPTVVFVPNEAVVDSYDPLFGVSLRFTLDTTVEVSAAS